MTRFCFNPEFISQPVIFPLQSNLVPHEIQVTPVPDTDLIDIIDKADFEIALLTPLQFALCNMEHLILKDIIISSTNSGKNLLLYFKENLNKIETIFFKESSYSQFMAGVILNEYFDVKPGWKALADHKFANLRMQKYPLLLLTDDDAIYTSQLHTNFLDLSEEWILKTELPYIHRMLVIRNDLASDSIVKKAIADLQLSLEIGLRNLVKISKSFSEGNNASWDYYHDLLENAYQYKPTEATWISLTNTLSYIFYYGKSNYIRDQNFY